MRVFFDTEFYEDGKTIDLMSIGLVRDDGKTLYMVNDECDLTRPLRDVWHVQNTLPSLIAPGDAVTHRKVIAREVARFVGDHPEFWAYYADYDWVVLCQLFGRMIDLPDGWPMYCRDFKQLCDQHGWKPERQTQGEHNALSDARWLKAEFERFQARKVL